MASSYSSSTSSTSLSRIICPQDVLEGSNLRAPLQELHQMIMTPIKAFSGAEEASLQRLLLSPEGKSAAPGSHLTGGGSGEAESGTSVIAEGDLPGQFTRVMGKGGPHASALGMGLLFMDWGTFFYWYHLFCFQFVPSYWCRGRTRTTSAPTYSSLTSAFSTRYTTTTTWLSICCRLK